MTRKRKRRSSVVEIGNGPAKIKIYTMNRRDGYPEFTLSWKEAGRRKTRSFSSMDEARMIAQQISVRLANGWTAADEATRRDIDLTRSLTRDQRCVEEMFRRAVFNVVAPDDDDHGRNHAFLMDDDGRWRPAPAYDLALATYPLASGFRAGRVNGKAADITRRDLIRLAGDHEIGNIQATIGRVTDSVSRWMDHVSAREIPRATANVVADQHHFFI